MSGGEQFGIYDLPDAVDTIAAAVDAIKPAVKSIQRGIGSYTGTDTTIEIALSTVDPDKCVVHLDSYFTGNAVNTGVVLSSIAANLLTLGMKGLATYYIHYSWQVVEYY